MIIQQATAPIRTLKAAQSIAGTLGTPSKMPGKAYGIPASACITGAKLHSVPNSVCSDCYAMKGQYPAPSVQLGQSRRLAGLDHPQWVDAMIYMIKHAGEQYFRWHDSGDLQSVQHLLNIVTVAEQCSDVRFWLPTREKKIVRTVLSIIGQFPKNLVIRVSAAMIDGDAPAGFDHVSLVHEHAPAKAQACPAPQQNGKCGDCRACWSRDVPAVSYHKH